MAASSPLQRSASGHPGPVLRQQPGQLTQSLIAALVFGRQEPKMQLTQGISRFCGLRVRPNPLLKLSPNGVSPGPGWRYVVHSRHPGPGATPSVPAAQTENWRLQASCSPSTAGVSIQSVERRAGARRIVSSEPVSSPTRRSIGLFKTFSECGSQLESTRRLPSHVQRTWAQPCRRSRATCGAALPSRLFSGGAAFRIPIMHSRSSICGIRCAA